MKRFTQILFLMFCLLGTTNIHAQVTIGSNYKPNINALLDVKENENGTATKGVFVSRMSQAARDSIVAPSNGLLIYNNDEDCFNYYSATDSAWISLCGGEGKASLNFNCSADVRIYGSYIVNTGLTSGNYLSISLNVTKKGAYEIKGTTSNGYAFYTNGVFLTAGNTIVNVLGQGTPLSASAGDIVTLYVNGNEQSCSPHVTIPVLKSTGEYSLECGSAVVNGVYKKGTALTSTNTITLPVNVSSLGSYSITTNTVDGISFSVSGTFTSTGSQAVTLTGTGTPTSVSVKTMTISAVSASGTSTCSVNVIPVIPAKTVLHIGYTTAYGYSAYTGPSRSLMDSETNFGAKANSVVKFETFTHTSLGTAPSNSQLLAALNNKPDIVILGYNYIPDATDAVHLAAYLNKKGVVIALTESSLGTQNMMRAIYSDPSISTSLGEGAGAIYALSNTNDPVLNGNFGDVRGKYWGEDASNTTIVSGLTGNFIPYSYAQAVNSTTSRTGVTALRHTGLNFIWFGDGGFLSNENSNGNQYTSNTIEPFVAPSTRGYFPIEKSAYGFAGNGYSAGSFKVQNSILFANMIEWAIQQAEYNGINTK